MCVCECDGNGLDENYFKRFFVLLHSFPLTHSQFVVIYQRISVTLTNEKSKQNISHILLQKTDTPKQTNGQTHTTLTLLHHTHKHSHCYLSFVLLSLSRMFVHQNSSNQLKWNSFISISIIEISF